MATKKKFLGFVIEQMDPAGQINSKPMFGEYGLYADGKFIAVVCDNQLFIKPTETGRNFINGVVEAPPYPGAKPWFLIEDKLEDSEWLSKLVRITAKALPEPKIKKRKVDKE